MSIEKMGGDSSDNEPKKEEKEVEKGMTHVVINDKFELVVSSKGLNGRLYFGSDTGLEEGPAVRYRNGNPYAPENISPRLILSVKGMTQEEYEKACEEYEKGAGVKTIGPYRID